MVRGLPDRDERLEAYKRSQAYLTNPRQVSAEFSDATILAQEDIQAARDLLPQVEIPEAVSQQGLKLVERLKVDSLRAEITMFEAARAHAVADARMKVTSEDLLTVAPMALRLRRSNFVDDYFTQHEFEEAELTNIMKEIIPTKKSKKK